MKAKRKKGRGRKRKAEEFEEGSADEAERLMGWIECEKCTVAFHWVSTVVLGFLITAHTLSDFLGSLAVMSSGKHSSKASQRGQAAST